MVYPIFLQYLGVAIDKTVLFCVVVSKKKKEVFAKSYPIQIYGGRSASILADQ